MASKKKPMPKKGKGVDVAIVVAPSGKMGGGKKPPPFVKGKEMPMKGKKCPECGGKVTDGVCQSCGYNV